jgi:hypothetical protein
MSILLTNLAAVLAVLGGVWAFVTALFHIAMHIGRLGLRVDRHDDQLKDHGKRIEHVEAVVR